MTAFDELSENAKLSAIYAQVLQNHVKLSDVLAKLTHMEALGAPIPVTPVPVSPEESSEKSS